MSFNFIRFLLVVFVLVVEVAFVAVVVVMLQCHVGVRWRLCVGVCVCAGAPDDPDQICNAMWPLWGKYDLLWFVFIFGQSLNGNIAMRYTLYNQYNIILENLTALVIWVQPD